MHSKRVLSTFVAFNFTFVSSGFCPSSSTLQTTGTILPLKREESSATIAGNADNIGINDQPVDTGISFLLTLEENSTWGIMPGVWRWERGLFHSFDKVQTTKRIEFEHHTVPPINMGSITNIVSRLGKPGVDFILMNPSEELKRLILYSNGYRSERDKILKLLSYTFQDDQVKSQYHEFHKLTTTMFVGLEPDGNLHRDPTFKGYVRLNFWIAWHDVKGRPLAFVKSDSTTQQRDCLGKSMFDHDRDPASKFTFIPDMKQAQVIAFLGDKVWHGSPVLEKPHDGGRAALVLLVQLERTSNCYCCSSKVRKSFFFYLRIEICLRAWETSTANSP
jgi:hypothetical protein